MKKGNGGTEHNNEWGDEMGLALDLIKMYDKQIEHITRDQDKMNQEMMQDMREIKKLIRDNGRRHKVLIRA